MTVAELAIGGMTCASCAARIERKLNRLDGVSAAVNFATETARVTFPATVRAEDLVSAVERAGYTALLAPGGQPPGDPPAWGATRPPKPPGLAAASVDSPGRPGGGAGDGPGVAVSGLAVGLPGAGVPGRGVGRVAVPPGRAGRRPARRGHHGHADLGRGGRRLPVVAGRADLRRGRRDVPGGRGGGDRAGPARPPAGGAGQAAFGRGAAGAAVAGREGRRGTARRYRGAHPCSRCCSPATTRLPPGPWPRRSASAR
jgi:copper chaperone CopZ